MSIYTNRSLRVGLITGWLFLIGFGFQKLLAYSNTAGPMALATTAWPANSTLKRIPGFATLVVFAHPECSCSRSTLGELERLIPFTKGKIKNIIVFVKPKGLAEDWSAADLWKKSESIPEAQTLLDEGGTEAEKFGGKTSGQVFLYDPNGGLVFEGGITPGRSHMGDSNGRTAILSYANFGKTEITRTPVFGCRLTDPVRALGGVNP